MPMHQSGFHVERRFGWDCHSLPVEYEIDKTLGIKVEIHNLHYPITMKSSKLHPLIKLLTPDLSVSGGINYILI